MTWEDVRKIIDSDPITLGPFYSGQLKGHWSLLRTMARYKFVANLVEGKDVLDLGCGEGLGTQMIGKYCKSITGVDTDKEAIRWARKGATDNIQFERKDIFGFHNPVDIVTAIDVIEHIPTKDEDEFMRIVTDNLRPNGFCVVGTPNVNMSQYESPAAKAGHINMYDHKRLERLVGTSFHNVMIFGMNDEVVYTGFKPMCQYLMAIGTNKR